MAGSLFSNAIINFTVNTQNALSQITGFQQKFQNSVGQMKTLIAGFVGYQGLRGAYDTLTHIVDTADKWNIPVEKVSKFSNLFTEFGGSTDEAVNALEKFQEMANQLRFHSSGPLRELSAVLRTNLGNKDYMGVIQALRGQWGHLTSEAQAEVQNMLGLDSAAMRRMLSASNEEFAKALKNSEKFNVVTEEQAKKIREMRKALAEVKQTLMQTAIPVLEALKPLLDVVRDLAMAFNSLDKNVQKAIVYGLLGATVIRRLGIISALFGRAGLAGNVTQAGTAFLGLKASTLGWLAVIGASATILWNFGKELRNVVNGTESLEQAMQKLEQGGGLTGAWAKGVNKGADWLAEHNIINKGNLAEQRILRAGWTSEKLSNEDLTAYSMGIDAKYRRGDISEDEYAKARQRIEDARAAKRYDASLKNPSFRKYYQSEVPHEVYKDATVNQVINIYGVKDAEDMMRQFKSIAEQSMTPIMGSQG